MIDKPAVFATQCPTPWVWRADPGAHGKIDPEFNREGQADKQVKFNFEKGKYDSKQNILGAVITGMNATFPTAYREKKGTGLATIPYRSSVDYAKHMNA